jgi:hypothetical protein
MKASRAQAKILRNLERINERLDQLEGAMGVDVAPQMVEKQAPSDEPKPWRLQEETSDDGGETIAPEDGETDDGADEPEDGETDDGADEPEDGETDDGADEPETSGGKSRKK